MCIYAAKLVSFYRNAGRTEVNYSMDKSLESIGVEPSKSIATEHKFVLQGAERQSLSIFSTTPAKGYFELIKSLINSYQYCS